MSYFNQTIDDITKAQVSKGRQAACRQVYDQFSSSVYNLAYRMLQNKDDAQDAMQNSFVLAFQKISQWSGQVAFGFWLRKIVINQCLNEIKKNHHQLTLDAQALATENDQIAYNYQHDLNILLAKLPPLSRSVLWLYEVEGLTHKEIAEVYEMSTSFSKSQLARSKQLLSKWLQNQEKKHEQQH
ncbi:RNA polymerase sigma factor [Marinicella marina]|uniref:RNA polymerase sigma factor n=1 Tax=Marinicella marina TaxID=2996016 RepID=UPI0024BC63F7|nr:RNA polymerase sigma factor [Marinicella marina]